MQLIPTCSDCSQNDTSLPLKSNLFVALQSNFYRTTWGVKLYPECSVGEHGHILIKTPIEKNHPLTPLNLNMNFPKRSTNTPTGSTHYYKMANEHVNSGTAKELLHSYHRKKEKTTLLAQDMVNINSIKDTYFYNNIKGTLTTDRMLYLTENMGQYG